MPSGYQPKLLVGEQHQGQGLGFIGNSHEDVFPVALLALHMLLIGDLVRLLLPCHPQAKCPDPVQRPQEMSDAELAVMGRLVLAHTSLLPSPKTQPQPKGGGRGAAGKGRGAAATGACGGSKRSRKGSPTRGGAAAAADGNASLVFPAVQVWKGRGKGVGRGVGRGVCGMRTAED